MNGIGYGNSMFLATHGILARGGTPAPSLLLDTYTNAAVAYSLRKLRTAYSGSAIRVRRSVDNAEQDIGFDINNDLDTTTMLDFVGYNIWTYSEDISQAVYTNSRSTETINSITAPDGNLTGGKVVEDLTLGEHGLNRGTTTILNATDYNISAYFKQGERTKIRIISNISGANQTCDLDLTNGTTSNNGFSNTPTVTAEANGWYRFSVTITSGLTSATSIFQFRTYNALNQLSYLGDGTSGVYVWGYQLSQTSTVKTYQKTVATAGGNGFVTTWYDQSTTGVNLTQITASIQPVIVRNGVLITENGKAAINDTIGTNNVGLGATLNGNANFYSFNVVKYIGDIHTMFSSQVNGSYFLVANSTDTTNPITAGVTSPSYRKNGSAITLTTRQGVATALSTYSLMIVKGNNSSWTRLGLGGRINGAGTMYKSQEYVIYYADKTADEIGIENNINAYWGIY